jgi:outer membrane protein OmpA-like peptidoglycan-associated protein
MTFAAALLTGALAIGATGDVSRLRPAPAPGELLGGQGSSPLLPGQYAGSLTLGFARNPVVWRYADGSYLPVVSSQLLADLGVGVGVLPDLDVGAVLPVALLQQGETTSLSGLPSDRRDRGGSGLGDLRLAARYGLVRARTLGFGLALGLEATLPTGDPARFRGEGAATATPRLMASLPTHIAGLPVAWDATLGARLRRTQDVAGLGLRSELEAHAGAAVSLPTARPWTALVELSAVSAATDPFNRGLFAAELLAGARTRFGATLVTVGGALGLAQGLGTPDFRLFVAFGWATAATDSDGDGIPDALDLCPQQAEDIDGYQDEDGCPEGGPPLAEPELGETELEEECPPIGTGVNTVIGEDGCPEPDSDADGIPDSRDKCPFEMETINGIDDDDGCPDEGPGQTLYIAHVKIEIEATILFETGRSTIKEESKTILNQVALQILQHPDVKRVRVEGHTDSMGNPDDNLFLSQDRADSVRRYLITRGVAKDRLVAVGMGQEHPIATNDTLEGRTKNRRVEFVIEQ